MPDPVKAGASDGRRARWDDHNAERRIHVLDAAVELLEELPSGSELRVQQIADRAGLVRTVVYRHFNGRADLNRAVQGHVVRMAAREAKRALVLTGTGLEVIERLVGSYVAWVEAHPALHEVAERALGDGLPGELDLAIGSATDYLAGLIREGAELLGLGVDEDMAAVLDLMVFGLIGQVRGTVALWIRRPERVPTAPELTTILSGWAWSQINGQAKALGIHLDPALKVEQLTELVTVPTASTTMPPAE